MEISKNRKEINIKEEFEEYVFEMVKELEKILNQICNEKDLHYIKKEIMFFKSRYKFINEFEKEYKKSYKIYQLMNQELKRQNKKNIKIVPFPDKGSHL